MSFSNELIKILDDLGRRFGVVVDWSGENILPYLQELVTRFIHWEVATSIIWMVFAIFVIVSSSIILKKAINIIKRDDYYGEGWFFGLIISIICLVIGIIVFLCQSFDIAKVVFLPELKIYEYINGLINLHS